jgi:anti-sigma factor RsiW
MNDCDQIALLLGAFQDGELEPHEMQEVARHLATCKSCEEELADYNAIGRELREVITIPPLTGFSAGVDRRIAALQPPLRERIGAFFESLNQRWAAAFAMVSMAGAVAVLTALVLTPYLRHNAGSSAPDASMAKADSKAESAAAPSLASATTDEDTAHVMVPSDEDSEQLASSPDMDPGDSHAVIKRLESQIPTTAVWSEPENGTTVIWLPSEQ